MDHPNLKEITVIFFTDGCDTCNGKATVDFAFEEMTKSLELMSSVKSRFLAIGFSSGHDAKFMNRIAQGGTEMGNFFYIDTQKPDYGWEVQECLSESLNMAMEGQGAIKLQLTDGLKLDENHALETNYQFADEEIDGMPVISGVTLSCQAIMKTKDVEGLAASLNFKDKIEKF